MSQKFQSPRFGKVEVVAKAKGFFEGPAFQPRTGRLYFVDLEDSEGRVWQLDAEGQKSVYVKTGSPINQTSVFGPDGALYIAQNATKSILRVTDDGKISTVVSNYAPAEVPGPNDIAFRRDGSFYFTCPDWENPTNGSVIYVSQDRRASEGAKQVTQPNGLGFSPDEKTLYVALTGKDSIVAYNLAPDGRLTDERTFAQFENGARPDGMVIDSGGTIYQALFGSSTVVALDPSGKCVARLKIDAPGVTNCDLAITPKGKSLYVTLDSKSADDAAVIRIQIL